MFVLNQEKRGKKISSFSLVMSYPCHLPRLTLNTRGRRRRAAREGGVVRNGESVSRRVGHTTPSSPGSRQCPSSLAAARRRRRPRLRSRFRRGGITRVGNPRAPTRTLPTTTPRVDSTENSNFGYVAPDPGKIGGLSRCRCLRLRRPDLVVDEKI